MTSSSKCDVCHIPSCIFDDKENLFLSCVGPPTPRTWERLANKISSEALPTLATSNFLLHTNNTWTCVPLISHMVIISNHQRMLSYCEHFQVPKPFYNCWTNSEIVPTCKQLCIAMIVISNFKFGFEM